MDRENVFDLFCRLTGLESTEAESLVFMSDTACDYVLSRIKNDVEISAVSSALELAAASLAYYRYVLWNVTDGTVGSVKVGDISVSSSGGSVVAAAERLCRGAFECVSDYLTDDGFVFGSMPYD